MRWRNRRRSSNVEDRRGKAAGRPMGGLRLPGSLRRKMPRGRAARRGGIGGIGMILLVVAALYFGVDPSVLFQDGTLQQGGYQDSPGQSRVAPRSAAEDELAEFVSVVLADTEETWHGLFAKEGASYSEPKLVLFTGAVESACGYAQAAVGPFYCPGDRKIYIDLGFYDELRTRFRAPGDFAQAYVVAHEVGHHIQTLLGISQKVHEMRRQLSKTEGNALSVRLELQADCLAGIWAHHADRARGLLEAGDLEEGLKAASAIGDDTMQRQAGRAVTPDSFTHGSSEQRVRWFKHGLASGALAQCDTFKAGQL